MIMPSIIISFLNFSFTDNNDTSEFTLWQSHRVITNLKNNKKIIDIKYNNIIK